jgi:hypothetical protein
MATKRMKEGQKEGRKVDYLLGYLMTVFIKFRVTRSDGRVNDELERLWKEVAVACYNVLWQRLSGRSEEGF